MESCSPNSTMSWGWLHRSWDVGCRFFLCDNLRKVQRASTTFLNHPSCHSYHFENPRLLKSQICHYFLSTWDQYAQMAIGFCLGGVIQHRHKKSGQVISTSHDQKPLKGSFLERNGTPSGKSRFPKDLDPSYGKHQTLQTWHPEKGPQKRCFWPWHPKDS